MADNRTLSDITAGTITDLLDTTLGHIRNAPNDKNITMALLAEYISTRVNKNEVYANAIINGTMQVDQRNAGAAVVGVTDAEYVVDRFQHNHAGTMVYDVVQDTDVPTTDYQYSLKTTITTGDTTIAAGDNMHVGQKIEGYNFAPYIGKNAVFSFWAKSSLAGTYCATFRNGGVDRSYVTEFTLLASTWTLIEIPIIFDYSGGTWNYTNGTGLNVLITLVGGSTYQTTPDAWQTGNYFATSNQVNFAETAANAFWFTDMKLNEGTIRYPYQPFTFQRTLDDCQRYYEKSYDLGVVPGTTNSNNIFGKQAASAIAFYEQGVSFLTRKRATPTVVIFSPNTGATGYMYNLSTTSDTVVTTASIGDSRFFVDSGGSFTLDQKYIGHYTADAEL
jgi:hypothetical protein